MEKQLVQNESTNYILNRTSIIELKEGMNNIFCENEIISLTNINHTLLLFQIRCTENLIYIIPNSNCTIYVDEAIVQKEMLIKARTIVSTNINIEFIIFNISVNTAIEMTDAQEILGNFINTGEIPNRSENNLLNFIKSGADKLQVDEFFSIIAQVDVPEID
jgi:hypothetical protein